MHPIAFHLGPWAIHWYGVMVATAFIAGLLTATRRCRYDQISPEKIADLAPWLIVGTIVGARALYVISYWREQFAGRPLTEIFMVQHGGLVFYGGLIGASLACIVYARRKQLPLWRVADVLAPSIALGYVFGRIGCLLNGCCYGRECSLPWAIHFPPGHETYPHGVHPTQVYDSILNLVFYFVLERLYRRKKFDGQVFAVYLCGYAVLRSVVECFRGDYPERQFLVGWITPAHLVSIGILLAGVLLWWLVPRTSVRTQPPRGTPS